MSRRPTRPDGPALRLPELIIPGAAKSATSSLHDYLGAHPDIYMSRPKEPHFFVKPERYSRGLGAYAELFSPAGGAAVCGESSTTYLLFSHLAAPRIAAALPEVRLVVVLRNPLDRIESSYRWLWSLGLERRPLREAVLSDWRDWPRPDRAIGGYKFSYYCAESRYAVRLLPFFEHLSPEQILVLTTEALSARPLETLNRIGTFVGVSSFTEAPTQRSNLTGGDGPRMTLADRGWLAGLLAEDIASLPDLTGRDFTEWSADFPFLGAGPARHAAAGTEAALSA